MNEEENEMVYLIVGIAALIVGTLVGFFGGRSIMKKYIEENSQVNEEMIRAMFMQMGMKPNQKKINKVMKAMEKHK